MSFRFFAVFVLFRETERLLENWLVVKTGFPPLDVTCPTSSAKHSGHISSVMVLKAHFSDRGPTLSIPDHIVVFWQESELN